MEFYQAHFGLQDYEHTWQKASHLYQEKEHAEAFLEEIGFKKVRGATGREEWEFVPGTSSSLWEEYYYPSWAQVDTMKVVD